MKFSSVSAALCALPFALGGLIAEPIARSNDHQSNQQNGHYDGTVIQAHGDHHITIVHEIVVLWVNNGGGAATSVVNVATSVQANGAAAAATHTVAVGGDAGLVFVPDSVNAAIGDSVVFVFYAQNHTVTQSTFDTPCKKFEGGFDSGFKENINNTVIPPPMLAFQVTVDTPLWFYCRQKAHCGKGMTFSINPSPAKSQADFVQLAIAQNGTDSTPNIVEGTTTVGGGGAAAATPDTISNVSSDMVTGSGSADAGGACSCSCLCGVSSFPLAAQGIGAFGGVPGSVPLAALTS